MCLIFRDLPAWSSGSLTGGQRRRLPRDVSGARRALNWTHGEEDRPAARPPSLLASEDKNQCLRVDVQQRVILAAPRWVDADSPVDENEVLAKLLKGRRGYTPGVSSNDGSYEYSWVSYPDSVVGAPPLIEMLLAGKRSFSSRGFNHGCCFRQEVRGEPGYHDPRLLRSARSYARLVCQTMKIGFTVPTLRPALRAWREKEGKSSLGRCRLP